MAASCKETILNDALYNSVLYGYYIMAKELHCGQKEVWDLINAKMSRKRIESPSEFTSIMNTMSTEVICNMFCFSHTLTGLSMVQLKESCMLLIISVIDTSFTYMAIWWWNILCLFQYSLQTCARGPDMTVQQISIWFCFIIFVG